jgi:hypothetical protein
VLVIICIIQDARSTGNKTIYTSHKISAWRLEYFQVPINPETPELNPSAQRCLAIFFTGDFAS